MADATHTNIADKFDSVTDVITNPQATAASGFAGFFTWVTGLAQEDIIFLLTAIALSCQIIAWVYRGCKTIYKAVKEKDEQQSG